MANPTKKENICGNMLTERKNDYVFFPKIFDPPKKFFFAQNVFFSKNKILKKEDTKLRKRRQNYERGDKITGVIFSPLQGKKHECG